MPKRGLIIGNILTHNLYESVNIIGNILTHNLYESVNEFNEKCKASPDDSTSGMRTIFFNFC